MIGEHEQRHIALLGSTGSIGRSTLDVVRRFPQRYRIVSLAAGRNIDLLTRQIREFKPRMVVVKQADDAGVLKAVFPDLEILTGSRGILEAVDLDGVDTLVSAITGTVALKATFRSIERGLRICLANKETLVAAGDLINRALEAHAAEILPIDSEQSAIFQALSGLDTRGVRRLVLTASGGPFLGRKAKELITVSPEQALAHPRWKMGQKISVDSATLMNKALEMIETRVLFQMEPDRIDVLVHPQSIVHSMVEFTDGSMLAQLGVTDMRLPILYALSHPRRVDSDFPRLDLTRCDALSFSEVDHATFPSLEMAREVMKTGGASGAVFNAANEAAVEAFLENRLTFMDIFSVVSETLARCDFPPPDSANDVEEILSASKRVAETFIHDRRT